MISGTATYTLYNVHENTISQGASLILTMVNLPVPTYVTRSATLSRGSYTMTYLPTHNISPVR